MPTYTAVNRILIETPGENGLETYTFPSEGKHIKSVRVNNDYIEVIEADAKGDLFPKGFRCYRRYSID